MALTHEYAAYLQVIALQNFEMRKGLEPAVTVL
jgi:hypothetical protein